MQYFSLRKRKARFLRFMRIAVPVLMLVALVGAALWSGKAEAAQNTIDSSIGTIVNEKLHQGTDMVFISDQVGYIVYRDSTNGCVYSKTTDGGTTWGAAVAVDTSTNCHNPVVWYDKWTPGDNGTIIHMYLKYAADDTIRYNELDTSTDTLSNGTAPVAINSDKVNTLNPGQNRIFTTKGTDGTLWAGVHDSGTAGDQSWIKKCSSSCNTAANWVDATPSIMLLNNQVDALMMPLSSGNILFILRDTSTNTLESLVYTSGTSSWGASYTTIDASTGAENATYRGTLTGTVNRSTGTIYIAYLTDNSTLGTDDDIRAASYSGGSWTNKTDVLTNSAMGITRAAMGLDENTGNIYVAYSAQTTAGTATSGDVYYKSSTDGMTSWSTQSAALDSISGDLYGLSMNIMSNERLYVTWHDHEATSDELYGNTVVDLTPPTGSVITQSAYHWYSNTDGITPNGSFANENTAASVPCGVGPLRLRMGLTIGTSALTAGSTQFKLQYGTSTSGPWTDVGAGNGSITKLADPATLPPNTGNGVAFSPDGIYLAVAHFTSPFITIYKRSGDTFTKLPDPATLPVGAGNAVAWSPDGTYLTVAQLSSPYITIYKRSGDTFTKLADPATLPPGDADSVAWSPDGTYMSVGHTSSPYVTIYKRSVDTFTKLANPATLPGSEGVSTAWSPDGNYMSVGTTQSPFVTIYSRSGDTFTKLSNPATLPTGISYGVAWSPDGTYMSVAEINSPYVTIYKQSGSTFTKLSDPATLPTSSAYGVAWSPDGNYMSMAFSASPYFSIYQRSGDTFTKLSDPATLPTGSGRSTAWSPDGVYTAVGHAVSPFITIYKFSSLALFGNVNNPSVTDGATLSASKLSGSPTLESYVESGLTPLNPNAIAISGKGEWDFAINAAAAPLNTYYFRMVKSDGTALGAYTVYPTLTITSAPSMDSVMRGGTFFAGEAKQPLACSFLTAPS